MVAVIFINLSPTVLIVDDPKTCYEGRGNVDRNSIFSKASKDTAHKRMLPRLLPCLVYA
jgi:hypothetical protein